VVRFRIGTYLPLKGTSMGVGLAAITCADSSGWVSMQPIDWECWAAYGCDSKRIHLPIPLYGHPYCTLL